MAPTKNYRFEAFLQRMMSVSEFSKIESYSPCVVQSSTEKLVFRHVVLTRDRIYLTDHPPRIVYTITDVADIFDIKTVSEQPAFLDGHFKKICQHIKIKCRSRQLHKKSWNKRKSLSEQNLSKIGVGFSLPAHQPLEKSNSDSTVLEATNGRSSRLSKILNLHFFTNNQANSPVHSLTPPIALKTNSFFGESFTPTEMWSRSSSRISNGTGSSQFSIGGRSNSQLSNSRRESGQLNNSRSNSQMSNDRSSSQNTNGRTSASSNFPSSETMINSHDSDEPNYTTEEINFYILNPNSKFITNLFLIWDNKLIDSTLSFEDDVISNRLPPEKNEKLEILFKQLTEELIANEKNDEFFHLLQELLSSLKKYRVLRLLLWKNSKLVQLLTRNLEEYLLGSNSKEQKLETREDELEVALIIIQIIHLSFMESDNSSLRQFYLTANKNKRINKIIQLSLSTPQLPNQYLNTTKRMLNNYCEFSSKVWNNLPEAELIQLSSTITNKQVLLISEIIKHGIADADNICQFIEEHSDQFISRSLTQFLSLLTKEEYYKPNEIILLYKYLYFLHFIMMKSEKIKWKICNDYNEEFRYYLNLDLILVKIINYCPLKSAIEKLIRDVNYIIN